MTQFKETEAFEDLQTRVCHEIAGVILGRLKEVGVPDNQLEQVSEDICYDLVAAMSEIGKYQVPGAEIYADVLKEKLREMAVLESKVNEFSGLEKKLEEIAVLEARVSEIAVLEASLEAKVKDMAELEANLEAKVKDMAKLEAQLKEMTAHQSRINYAGTLKQGIDERDVLASIYDNSAAEEVWADASEDVWSGDKVVLKRAEIKNQPHHPEESILSPDKALSILNAAR